MFCIAILLVFANMSKVAVSCMLTEVWKFWKDVAHEIPADYRHEGITKKKKKKMYK